MIKTLLTEIDKYSARNRQEREERNEAERRRQHEAQHAKLLLPMTSPEEEQGVLTDGSNTMDEEEEEEKEVDPSLVGSLDDVYPDEPGADMREEDPFSKVPVKDDHQNLMQMERSLDAMAQRAEHDQDPPSPMAVDSPINADVSSLDLGVRDLNLATQLPDLVGVASPPPLSQSSNQASQTGLPLDLAVGARCSVDLLENASPVTTQPVDLTQGLENSQRTLEQQAVHGNS